MSAPSRGGSAVSALLRSQRSVCTQCRQASGQHFPRRLGAGASVSVAAAPRRFYSEASTTTTAQPTSSSSSAPIPPHPVTASEASSQDTTSAAVASRYRIKSGLILTRPPILTRELTPFEEAFFLYQKRLNERLTAPFRRAFFFKKDTAADLDWRIKLKERKGVPNKDIGRYNPRGRMAWNDEVMVGSTTSSTEYIYDRLLTDAEMRVSEDGEEIPPEDRVPVERPMPRRTEADEKNDVRRLDRALDRTLYLVVRKGAEDKGIWQFPAGDVPTHENLHEAAARVLAESAGVNMNSWIVSRIPVAHHVVKPVVDEATGTLQQRGEKVFFLKGRIFHGQANLTDNKHGLTDFKWLTKDELPEVLDAGYWKSVRNMMSDR